MNVRVLPSTTRPRARPLLLRCDCGERFVDVDTDGLRCLADVGLSSTSPTKMIKCDNLLQFYCIA